MAPERKRRIPRFCMRVAVVTSLSGSVIDDVKRTLARRNPLVALDVVGCAVQGPHAPQTIIRALDVAASSAPEAILLVRGGGSFEDLMTFNDEALARAVANCAVPVITGIGHEPDTCICDMVADRRASTPTAAAESVAPAIDEVVETIEARRKRMGAALQSLAAGERMRAEALGQRSAVGMQTRLSHERAVLDALTRRRCLEDPFAFIEDRQTGLMQTEQRLHDAIPRVLDARDDTLLALEKSLAATGRGITAPHAAKMGALAASLEALSPLRVLACGYAIARDETGRVVSDARSLSVGEEVHVALGTGSFDAQVTNTTCE